MSRLQFNDIFQEVVNSEIIFRVAFTVTVGPEGDTGKI